MTQPPASHSKRADWEAALARFGILSREETTRLLSMSKQTLTFTVTYRAVSSLVVDDGHGSALLGVAVFVALFIIVAASSFLNETLNNGQCESTTVLTQLPTAVIIRLIKFLSLCNDIAVQFLSNLIAVVLSTTFAEAENVWWIIAFAAIGLALVGHVATAI